MFSKTQTSHKSTNFKYKLCTTFRFESSKANDFPDSGVCFEGSNFKDKERENGGEIYPIGSVALRAGDTLS